MARAVRFAAVVDDERDAVGDALLGLTHEVLARPGGGGPDDAPRVVTDDVVTHAVELEPLRPRLRDRRPERRGLPHAPGGAGDEPDRRPGHGHLDRGEGLPLVAGGGQPGGGGGGGGAPPRGGEGGRRERGRGGGRSRRGGVGAPVGGGGGREGRAPRPP